MKVRKEKNAYISRLYVEFIYSMRYSTRVVNKKKDGKDGRMKEK